MSNLESYYKQISTSLNINVRQAEKTISLLNEGATVPFISRYRKEATGELDEVQVTEIRDLLNKYTELDKRRHTIIETIESQGKLNDALNNKIKEADSMVELEDIYLPYRPKRKTRASIAKEKGLESLANLIFNQNNINLEEKAAEYVNKKKEVNTIEDAISGARDIIAEKINEDSKIRGQLRNLFQREAKIYSKVQKGKEEEGQKYESYFKSDELLQKAPSHRLLAMFRGENESFLRIKIHPGEEDAIHILSRHYIKTNNACSKQISLAINDAYKRLLSPSLETEIRHESKQKADTKAISVFTENLRQLLLEAPLGRKNVLAIDPGFRTGCKVVCLDRQGKLLHNETIFPHPPKSDTKRAMAKIQSLVSAYKIEAIAIGNGTAGRETESFIKRMRFDKDLIALMVNENGASIYSASQIARDEFPDYDITVRGAVSIGRRLMDPLAELVKIEPKSIGVGQYQHDVDQGALQKSLEDIVVSCVNKVGVEINTASKQLLSYVSGVGNTLAQNIIEHRNNSGAFSSINELKKVARFGPKAFEQAAGFMRIRDAKNLLDNTAVHPESYHIVKEMAKRMNCDVKNLINNTNFRENINLDDFISGAVGLPTLKDILDELEKPGLDPRCEVEMFTFDQSIREIEDLVIGKKYPGIATNITAFGAFVDIGVHQDGLVHISQLADKFVSDPNEIVKLNQKLIVKVLDVDIARKRIQLSLKTD